MPLRASLASPSFRPCLGSKLIYLNLDPVQTYYALSWNPVLNMGPGLLDLKFYHFTNDPGQVVSPFPMSSAHVGSLCSVIRMFAIERELDVE